MDYVLGFCIADTAVASNPTASVGKKLSLFNLCTVALKATSLILRWKTDVKLYLIFILFGPLHLCWGVSQVLWTFIKLMLHGVDGMTAREKMGEKSVIVC